MSPTRDWESWARTFESIDGPDEFAALFAPGGRFMDPVTPWTTDLHKVATDTDAIFPDWNQRVDRIRGGEDWAVFEWTGTATFNAGEGKAGIPVEMTGATVIDVDDRRQGHRLARLSRHQRAHPADSERARAGHRRRLSTPTPPSAAWDGARDSVPALGRHRLHVRHPDVAGLVEILRRLLVAGHLGVDVGESAKPITPMSRRPCATSDPRARCHAGWARSA